jgi:hypothetical protein
VVECSASKLHHPVVEDESPGAKGLLLHGTVGREGFGAVEDLVPQHGTLDFPGFHREFLAVHEVPGVPPQPALDVFNHAGGAEDSEVSLAPQKHAQEAVETDEVVDVRMGEEKIGDAQCALGAKAAEFPAIEEQGPALPY